MNKAGIKRLEELGYTPAEVCANYAEATFQTADGSCVIEVSKAGTVVKTRGCAVRSLTKDEISALALLWDTQKPKAHWIHRCCEDICSNCRFPIAHGEGSRNYCPECGFEMEVEDGQG